MLGHTVSTPFPRSLLLPGTKPFSLTLDDGVGVIPGPGSPDMHGRAEDVEKDRERVGWIKLPSDDLGGGSSAEDETRVV